MLNVKRYCNRCINKCSTEPKCKVIDLVLQRDRLEGIVYIGVMSTEQRPLHHVNPGTRLLRIVLPGAIVDASDLWWNSFSDVDNLVIRSIDELRLKSILARVRPSTVLIDGCEPLILDYTIKLMKIIRRISTGFNIALGVKTCGMVDIERLKHSIDEVNPDFILFEYLGNIITDIKIVKASMKFLQEVMQIFKGVLEILLYIDNNKLFYATLKRIADILKSRCVVHLVPLSSTSDDALNKAYRIAYELRSKRVNVYLYNDTSYTLTDTLCPYCGNILVERKPWGVSIRGRLLGNFKLQCPNCKHVYEHIICLKMPERILPHREIVVW